MGRLGQSSPKLAPTEHPSLMDVAWAAGVYEGEGSIKTGYSLNMGSITVTQNDMWLLERLRTLFGGNIHVGKVDPRYASARPCHYWLLTGARARGFAMTIYRFLSPRRQEQMRRGLNGVFVRPARTHCKQGHELAEGNISLRHRKTGRIEKVCLACKRAMYAKISERRAA